ncbi:MAG: PBP1A family penicillin-binding protein [Patescibacteria group bacterium]|nr:PBP1A family penicillin-binding protein [Patescibacteria group bacterium]
MLFGFAAFCGVFFVLGIIGVFAYFAKDLPNPAKMEERRIIESTKIYDRTGQIILYDIHGEEKRTVIPFKEIPQSVKNATIVIEDDNFYHHIGLDWKGILRAAWANLNRKKISQGGSTITQQFIKNAYLGGPQSERTYSRKIKEAILAIEIERKYTKNEILGFYLNQVPYGSSAYGIESASWTFFNKPAKELTLSEAALLASLPKAPSYYSPYGSHPKELKNRQEYVLDRMVKFGYISKEQSASAKEEKIQYTSKTNLKAHHFVTMVKEYLEEKYSQTYTNIDMAGLKVYTTLDWDLQQLAEKTINEGVIENEKNYSADNAALVAIDPKTGQILSLVGSKNYKEDQFNVATSPYRQPGSSFKPFAYAAAFKKGFSPESVLFDLPTSFGKFGPGQGTEYAPNNYDLKFRGPITFRDALAQSINLPSVKVLYLAGVNDTINLAQDMGITTLKDRQQYGLSLVLGGGEVKLIDETAAYGVFATEGVKHPTTLILKIEDTEGNILEEYYNKTVEVLDKQIALQITDILSDEAARAPMFGNYSKLYLPDRPAAAKTGTTQNYTDGWTIGYTPSLVVGVWAGNNDFTKKMKKGAAGLYVAAPIWNNFMKEAYKIKTNNNNILNNSQEFNKSFRQSSQNNNQFTLPKNIENFTSPEPISSSSIPMLNGEITYNNKIKIDKISKKLATELTPPNLIKENIYQEVHCVLYYLAQSIQDSQFQNWETPVLEWALKQSRVNNVYYNQNPPAKYDDIHTLENQPEIKITSPKQNNLISQPVLTIEVEAKAPLGIKQVDFFFNNQLISADTIKPYFISFNMLPYLTNSSKQIIKVRAYDTVFNKQEDEVEIKTIY